MCELLLHHHIKSPEKSICGIYIFLVSCHLDISDSKIMLRVKSLQGELLILISVLLDCSRENALNVTVQSLTIGPLGLVACGCNTQQLVQRFVFLL